MLVRCYGEASNRLETVTAVMRTDGTGVEAVGRIAHLTTKRQHYRCVAQLTPSVRCYRGAQLLVSAVARHLACAIVA